ncbi:MAG: bifunctional acetaldehyde-CoA/alcohol dehydrogenase [Rickettsiales bacterium]|jgi:acetaldehyde dehydrogenase/alcohol dehydrogenase|nr:bifunctional acetaldehyde-CoA/alcohol dehydrogenase [Rickettsiales bacterium]
MVVNSMETLDDIVARVKKAQSTFASYSQEQVDEIFRRVALAICGKRIPLAKMAVEETGMGVVEDKVIKNHFAAEYIYNKYKNTRTCGLVERDPVHGIRKIACPVGVIAGIVPTTNPTSTAIFKGLIALKTRNGIVVSPHPRAKRCTVETLRLMLELAVEAGAPKDIIGWIDEPTIELSSALMSHRNIDLILATGGPAMVKAAYSSGTPALGVGAGNTPAVIDETADLEMAVSSIILSKTFDNGMICASEQSVLVVGDVYARVREEFERRGCYILKREENKKLADLFFSGGKLNAAIVGQSAPKIASLAGIGVPPNTKILLGEVKSTGKDEPFAHEKLSPILALYRVKDLAEATRKAQELIELGGNGHTSVLYTGASSEDRIKYYSDALTTARVLINSPASQGALGDLFNFRLEPSLTLGCGSWGRNSVSENIGVRHLINIKTVAEREENMLWFRVPPKIYFKKGCVNFALRDLAGKKKAFIITDRVIFDLGYSKKVTDVLEEIGISHSLFSDVEPDPSLGLVRRALASCRNFQPDVIIALGGGSPIDAAKMVWLMYEQPEIKFEDIALRFLDIRKRSFVMPSLGKVADLVCIPTTSGTGSEVTPFTIITDESTNNKYAIADYAFTPSMAIVDPDLATTMPRGLAAASGIDALVHGLEAYVSTMASPFTDGLALQAIRMVFSNLERAVNGNSPEAREQMHYAANIAGMAFSNAFLGVCHSLAHKLGARFHIPHGIANAYCISQVIRFNSSEKPLRQAAFAQYRYPFAGEKYVQIADFMGFGGRSPREKIDNLIAKVEELKAAIGIARSIGAEPRNGFSEGEFRAALGELAERAFDDQCTGSNPRYPLIGELEQLLLYAYEGNWDFDL